MILRYDVLSKMWDEAYEIWRDVLKDIDYFQENLVDEYMADKLFGTQFKIIHTKSKSGHWSYKKREMAISDEVAYVRGYDFTMNTVLHEMLHGLTPMDFHTGKWKEWATEFNKTDYSKRYGNIKRCYSLSQSQADKIYVYKIRCDECGIIHGKIRMSDTVRIWKWKQDNKGNVGKCKCGRELKFVSNV